MAAAMLCDICNKAYTISEDNCKIRILKGKGDLICHMSIKHTWDCCPECYEKISNFIAFTKKEIMKND